PLWRSSRVQAGFTVTVTTSCLRPKVRSVVHRVAAISACEAASSCCPFKPHFVRRVSYIRSRRWVPILGSRCVHRARLCLVLSLIPGKSLSRPAIYGSIHFGTQICISNLIPGRIERSVMEGIMSQMDVFGAKPAGRPAPSLNEFVDQFESAMKEKRDLAA